MKPMRRRDFIKYSGGLIGLLLFSKYVRLPQLARATDEVREQAVTKTRERVADGLGTVADRRNHFTMVIDAGACIGCRRCQWACKQENNIPDVIAPPWIEVFELPWGESVTAHPSMRELQEGATTAYTEFPKEDKWYLPVQCYQCDNPPCVTVCPVGATYLTEDGVVLIDQKHCIGCGYCIQACPYGARFFLPDFAATHFGQVRVVDKCTWCYHRITKGLVPACVEVCPVKAQVFGDLREPESPVRKILAEKRVYVLKPELGTEPKVYYIGFEKGVH